MYQKIKDVLKRRNDGFYPKFQDLCKANAENRKKAEERLKGYEEKVKELRTGIRTNFWEIGVILRSVAQNGEYTLVEGWRGNREEEPEYAPSGGKCAIGNQGEFFYWCGKHLGISRTTAYLYMQVVEEYSRDHDMKNLSPEWFGFNLSQLIEMLPMEEERRKEVREEWSVRKIRAFAKNVGIPTSGQEDDEADEEKADAAEAPKVSNKYAKYSKQQLIDRVNVLEKDCEKYLATIDKQQEDILNLKERLAAEGKAVRGRPLKRKLESADFDDVIAAASM